MKANFNCSTSEISSFVLREVLIGEIKTKIEVCNAGALIDFCFDCGFDIRIDERGVSFSRTLRRPDHDHDDTEYLYISPATGALDWRQSRDCKETDWKVFRMRFGPRTEGESE